MKSSWLLYVVLGLSAPVFAADAVTDALSDAYAPYRVALFKTSSAPTAEAAQAVEAARQRWQQLIAQHGAQPGAPYDRDPSYATSLQDVLRAFDTAATQARGGDLTAAHETLEKVRDLLAALRARNNIIVFSDHMNAYHAAMEKVLDAPMTTSPGPEAWQQLTMQVGVLEYLANRLVSEAPPELRQQEEFESLLGNLRTSVTTLKAAVLAADPAAVKAALGKLKMPYSKLFVRFG